MDEALRRSAAHLLVDDITAPELDDASAHHLGPVLRLRDGAEVTVTDGCGRWRSCRVSSGTLETVGDVVEAAALRPTTIAVAAPKGDRLDWLVQKVTEIGVSCVVLLTADRSVVRWDVDRLDRHMARLRRIASEAAMQSRRTWLPELCGPVPAAEFLPTSAIAEPGGRAVTESDTTIAIGPEGGWSPAELAITGDCVCLGPNVLRVETAAVVAATLMVTR